MKLEPYITTNNLIFQLALAQLAKQIFEHLTLRIPIFYFQIVSIGLNSKMGRLSNISYNGYALAYPCGE